MVATVDMLGWLAMPVIDQVQVDEHGNRPSIQHIALSSTTASLQSRKKARWWQRQRQAVGWGSQYGVDVMSPALGIHHPQIQRALEHAYNAIHAQHKVPDCSVGEV